MEKPQVLQGFRDYLPEMMDVRQHLIDTTRQVYESYGFLPLDTPALEYAEVLTGKYGEDEKLIYHFEDNGGREVALRYDLTVPLARVIASHPELPKPFKRYQVALAWRAESPQKGRFREFLQMDVDTVGSSSPLADAEIVAVVMDLMAALKLDDYVIRLNHRQVLNAIMDYFDIPQKEYTTVLRQVDKVEKIGRAEAEKNLIGVLGEKTVEALFNVLFTDEENVFAHLESLFNGRTSSQEAVANFKDIVSLIETKDKKHFRIDLSIARGLDYYTGLVMETNLLSHPKLGSVCSGGRYDQLMGKLAGVDLPAVGTSLGVDRLLTALAELESSSDNNGVMMAVFAGLEKETFALADKLRKAGIRVTMAVGDQKLGKQMQYANAIGAKVVLIYGQDEAAKKIVAARDMETGEQAELALEPQKELVSELRKIIGLE